tara:strand:- start:508 stop:678 length:171 start_codon:yes stop_codon:yes gene_type:complete
MSRKIDVNWYDEGLDKFYGHDNEGKIYGVYHYDDTGEDVIEVDWYTTEKEREDSNA